MNTALGRSATERQGKGNGKVSHNDHNGKAERKGIKSNKVVGASSNPLMDSSDGAGKWRRSCRSKDTWVQRLHCEKLAHEECTDDSRFSVNPTRI